MGYSFNEQFSNDNATSIIISEDIAIMLVAEPFFKTFIGDKEIGDAQKTTTSLICLSAESREKVDELVSLAVEAGGIASATKQDHGWMYGHGFEDLDGHLWELAYMDFAAMPQNL